MKNPWILILYRYRGFKSIGTESTNVQASKFDSSYTDSKEEENSIARATSKKPKFQISTIEFCT